jgi:hypothetical protein
VLATVLPEAGSWVLEGGNSPEDLASGEPEAWFDLASPIRPEQQRLVVLLRRDGDIQVEYHVAGVEGSPFEALFSIPAGHEGNAIAEVARFVHGLVVEHLVLAMDPRAWRGGRLFLEAGRLGESPPGRLSWVTSWRGTYDQGL